MPSKLRTALGAALLLPIAFSQVVSPASAGQEVSVSIKMDAAPQRVSSTDSFNSRIVSANSGAVSLVPSRPGSGKAASFPAFGSRRSAAVAVTNSGTADRLAPGASAFAFGADFRTAGGKADGDNIMQRGLADDAGQYKLEVDSGVVACTIKGRNGAVTVRSGPSVVSNVWYSARCERNGAVISLSVTRLDNNAKWSNSKPANVGIIATRKPTTPLTVGAKVTPAMQIANWSPDQFNGLIDNVFVRIAG